MKMNKKKDDNYRWLKKPFKHHMKTTTTTWHSQSFYDDDDDDGWHILYVIIGHTEKN